MERWTKGDVAAAGGGPSPDILALADKDDDVGQAAKALVAAIKTPAVPAKTPPTT